MIKFDTKIVTITITDGKIVITHDFSVWGTTELTYDIGL